MTAITRNWNACLVASLALIIAGCGDNADPGSPLASSPNASHTAPYAGSCQSPAVGCPCTVAGETADCGQVDRVSGTYVTCSMGTMTCSNGSWGTCTGDRITTQQ